MYFKIPPSPCYTGLHIIYIFKLNINYNVMSIAINNDQQSFVTEEILKILLGMDL